MKKLLAALAVTAVTLSSAFACWFTQDNFNNNYIAGVNNYFPHYSVTESMNTAVYRNNMKVDLPITVWFKVSPRYPDQAGEDAGAKPITGAILQYRILPNGNWVTVKTINNPSWKMDFSNPVALFGRNNIKPTGITAGTKIMIRVYLTDGTFETGDLSDNLSSANILSECTLSNPTSVRYSGGWTAPFVMVVEYSGKTRPVR